MTSGFGFGVVTSAQNMQPQSFFTTTSSAGPAPATTTISLFGANPATSSGTGFSFATPATNQPPQQAPFSLGLGTTTTSIGGTGFSFGGAGTVTTAQPSITSTVPSAPLTGTTSLGGLGGVPSSGSARISSLAMGSDPGTAWSTRNDNRAVQELPVPPELVALVEELKNEMKKHKTAMQDITRATDLDIDTVSEQIDEVRMGISTLSNVMHKQELHIASLIKEMQELGKDVDLLAQCRDVPAYGYGGTSTLVLNYLYELVDKYSKRMMKYKMEIERSELSLQTLVDVNSLSAKELWDSLTAIKESVILLAAQIQQLHEDIRNELTVHRNFSQFLLGNTPKAWLANALSGNLNTQSMPPLEKLMSTPSMTKAASASTSLEALYNRTYSMMGRVPSFVDSRGLPSSSSESMLRGSHEFRTQGLGASAYAPSYSSAIGSYVGTSPPSSNVGLKRSKK